MTVPPPSLAAPTPSAAEAIFGAAGAADRGPVPVLAATLAGTELAMVAAIGVLLLLTAFLSLAESGLTRLNRSKVEALVEEHRRGATALRDLVDAPRSFLTPVRFLALLCQLVQATLVGIVGDRIFGVVGLVVATAVNVLVVFVLAESAPKTWAVLNPERAALVTARQVRFLVGLPPVRLLSQLLIGLTNMLVPGKGLEQGPFLSEEELLAIAERGVEEGVIEADERALIESIIEFGDTIVREVMVPRPDMVTVDASFRVADVMEVVLLNGYSRLPVRGEGIDDVIGLVFAKDLMRAERDGLEAERVSELLRAPHLVPETKRVPELLREMQRDKFHMAIVVDEYGGTAGLVTLEDLIEELVGEIVDEFDVEDPVIEPLPGGDLRVHARTALDEVNDLLHADLPEGDWDSIGGLLYHELGRVPMEDEAVDVAGWRLVAQRVQGRRIGRVLITRIPAGAEDDGAGTSDADDVEDADDVDGRRGGAGYGAVRSGDLTVEAGAEAPDASDAATPPLPAPPPGPGGPPPADPGSVTAPEPGGRDPMTDQGRDRPDQRPPPTAGSHRRPGAGAVPRDAEHGDGAAGA
ncbi:MAG TPA: hemolysin family protein [Acidimicrobiales bacterium]|nr:hemolysin family protein [Acidimicrobiales bacterium]